MSAHTHHQNYLRSHERMQAELDALEERAGVRERHAAFVEYNGDADLRRLYFSVLDQDLRKALIEQCRRFRMHATGFSTARLADAIDELAAIEGRGLPTPWAVPALLTCAAVWLGYSLWALPGALAGAAAGFFAGSAFVSHKRNLFKGDVTLAKHEVEELRAEVERDQIYFDHHSVFSETEETSGGEDEGRQPEPSIHWYARLGHVRGIEREIKAGVSVELENNVDWGSRPLHRAAANGNVDVISLLISAGADVRARNTLHGWLPIHYAARRGSAEALRVLINAGSPIDARDTYDHEPIHQAAESGESQAVRVLLEAGAKVDAKGGPHQTQPIHEAARAGDVSTVETLLVHGADPNAENIHGARPLYFASLEKTAGHQKTIRVLEAAGARRKEQPEPA